MKQSEIQVSLLKTIRNASLRGEGYVIGKGYNQGWTKAAEALLEAKKIRQRSGEFFVTEDLTAVKKAQTVKHVAKPAAKKVAVSKPAVVKTVKAPAATKPEVKAPVTPVSTSTPAHAEPKTPVVKAFRKKRTFNDIDSEVERKAAEAAAKKDMENEASAETSQS